MKKWVKMIASLCVPLMLAGCSSNGMDVENSLRAPKQTGDQQKLEQALSDYVASAKIADNYVLKYPKNGDYRSAFIVQDLDGDGNTEAIAFYRAALQNSSDESGNIHINLLRQEDGVWSSASDIVGYSTDIESVTFGDLEGDGVKEMFIGWDISSTQYNELSIYSIINNTLTARDVENYSALVVGKIISSDKDDFITFNVNANADGTGSNAKLWQLSGDGTLKSDFTVPLETADRFQNIRIAPIATGYNGVYTDIVSGNQMSTELLYWDGSKLVTPFFDPDTKSNTQTVRDLMIPSSDINNDTAIEWPNCKLLYGITPDNANTDSNNSNRLYTQRWLTTFSFYDPGVPTENEDGTVNIPDIGDIQFTITKKFSCIYNQTDGYYLQLQDSWLDHVTAVYDDAARVLTLKEWTNDKVGADILAIKTTSLKETATTAASTVSTTATSATAGSAARQFTDLTQNDTSSYSVWYDTQSSFVANYGINKDSIQYMVVMLP